MHDFTESSCISLGSDSSFQCVVHDSDYQLQSSHVQDSRVDISKDSSVSDIISTSEASVLGHFSDVFFGCSPCFTDVPPSQNSCTTPESVVVSCQSDAEVSTHVLLSNDVVMLPSHYGSFDRFSSQSCYVLCTQKTALSTILTVCFPTMMSVMVYVTIRFH